MGIYVDGFVIPVPKKKVAAYRAMARKAGKVWMEHGALGYVEAMADDVQHGKWTSFPRAVKLRRDEVVWFSYITYRSRQHRDRVNARVMKDPRMAAMMSAAGQYPFDAKRMIHGGFRAVVEA